MESAKIKQLEEKMVRVPSLLWELMIKETKATQDMNIILIQLQEQEVPQILEEAIWIWFNSNLGMLQEWWKVEILIAHR